ncbi:hypothetical protein F5B22DRAFT_633904 [Xylaria bambusicola]|uniref:uncharacterized protein n=1 Tax=Xylaria bambusicola TaxID=326684 RepID=UPI00200899B5|nr:uncharacterized protein F5B22DRAFT_633904 [Xylaria bambusicola]KAI0523814.1 hypothetical protein F5B22DRAFT_633904 [Xylaria bambusicola]
MSSFFSAAMRLLTQRKPSEGHMSNEHEQTFAGRPQAGEPSMIPPVHQESGAGTIVPRTDNRPVYLNSNEDSLTLFRLMLGIQSTPYLGFTLSSPIGTRPAANIGLYARIVHSEQKAKDSFKVFSVVINGCYFLQIVIAAALTALGAAGANSGAVTAFGALNTVIAGFLTFLKGSGLPGRLKYYGNEWKKIREFIEQRERDFMRPGHNLNVYEVIDTIEKMYNNLKADIELNTPDSYTSVTNQRRVGDEKEAKIGGIDMSKLESIATKLKGFDNEKLDSLTASITRKTEDVTKSIHEHEKQIGEEVNNLKKDVIRDVQSHKAHLDREAKQREAQALAAINEGKQTARDAKESVEGHVHARALSTINDTGRAAQEGIDATTSHATSSISGLVREISDIHRTALSGGRRAAAQQIRSLALRLGGHEDDDDHEEGARPGARKPQGKPGS